MSNFTVSGGVSAAGGLAAYGTTTLDHMAITANQAAGIAGGLFIGPGQTAIVSNSAVTGNTSAGVGGGIVVSTGASLTLTDSTVSNNTSVGGGGGIFVYDFGSLAVFDSTISGNSTTGAGAGIYARIDANLSIHGSTISGNTATTSGGGVYMRYGGSLSVADSTISGNATTSPSSGNYIYGGAGIASYSLANPLVLRNTTIANNTSAGSGGAVLMVSLYTDMQVANCTISGNSAADTALGAGGGGIAVLDPGTGSITIQNSVISGNSNANGPDILAASLVQVYAYSSLIFAQTGFTLAAGSANYLIGIDPLLGPLQDNGGPTPTMAPLADSPLLEAGDNSAVPPGVTTDQRGLSRLDPATGTVDIGAVEAQAATVTIDLAAAQPALTNGAGPVVFDVVFDQPVTGFGPAGIDLSGSTAAGPLSAAVDQLTPSTYTVTVTGITGDGDVVASVLAGTGTVGLNASGQFNLPSPAAVVVTVDATAPTVTITAAAGQRDPTNDPVLRFLVQFSEDTSGFDAADVVLASSIGDPLVPAVFAGPNLNSYVVTVTGVTALSTITASVRAAAVQDPAGNDSLASASTQVTFDNVAPTVTVSLSAGQASTGGGTSVSFDVVFSEPVVGFDGSKVNLGGSTEAGLVATVTGAGPAYTVTVTGMTGGGTVALQVDAATVADPAGNDNLESNSASVTYIHAGTIQFPGPTYTTDEGVGTFHVPVHRQFATGGAASVAYTVTAVTASGADYTDLGIGTLTWGDGVTDQFIDIAITDDALSEGRETINLTLSNPAGDPVLGTVAVLGTQSTAALTIAHSDGIPGGKPFFEDGPTAPPSDKVTPNLAGGVGTLTYYLTNGVGPISEIVLDGTDAVKSVVTLAVVKPLHGTGDGRVQIGQVTQTNGTGVRSLLLAKADLVGAGIDIAGYLGALTIGDIKNGADIAVHGAPPLTPAMAGTRIRAGRILGTAGQESDITFTDPRGRLSRLSAVSVGAGTITAATVGRITVRGKAATTTAPAVLGDFASDLVVTGPALTLQSPALGRSSCSAAASRPGWTSRPRRSGRFGWPGGTSPAT